MLEYTVVFFRVVSESTVPCSAAQYTSIGAYEDTTTRALRTISGLDAG